MEYWRREPGAPESRIICHNWVVDPFWNRFGVTFHQSKLRRLVQLGFLRPEYTVRGGTRRYYSVVNPDRLEELLQGWELN